MIDNPCKQLKEEMDEALHEYLDAHAMASRYIGSKTLQELDNPLSGDEVAEAYDRRNAAREKYEKAREAYYKCRNNYKDKGNFVAQQE